MDKNNMICPIGLERNCIPGGLSGGFFIYNAKGDNEIYYADRNVISLFECDTIDDFRKLTGNSFKGMVHPEDYDRVDSNILAQTFKSGKRHDYVRYRIITNKGNIRYVEDFGHLLHSKDGRVFFYVYIVDLEKEEYYNGFENSFAEAQVFSMNDRVDRLTGLLNMTAFYEEAQEVLLDRSIEQDKIYSIVIFDILGLGKVNRTFGRDEGDARILSLVAAIRKHMPAGCRIFRGHEADLIVVCRNITEQELMPNVMKVVNTSKSVILFGIGSTCPDKMPYLLEQNSGTVLQTLEEAQYDLKVKKMLSHDSEHSQALTSLVRALEETDPDTEEHVLRTQQMGEALGRKVGLSDARLTSLKLLCLLHDIGKITVPLEILNKPGKLSDSEWAALRTHAEKGYQIAMSTDELRPIAEMIRCHHERWDGKGYPTGLKGEEIPVLSRIISIVDAYDAMVNDRSYRKAMHPSKAQKEIKDNAGTQFDPYLASEFLKLLEEAPELAVGRKTGSTEVREFKRSQETSVSTGNTMPVIYTQYKLDIDDKIIEVDERFEKLTGYKKEEAVGKMTQFDLIPPADLEQYKQQLQAQFVGKDIAYLRHRILCRDGSIKTVICNGERYFDSSVKALRSDILVFEI